MTISILVVDDHNLIRKGVCALLKTYPEFQVTGEAVDGTEALEMVGRLHPDVVIIDFVLPGRNGLEVSRLLLKHQPDLAVVMMSMYDEQSYVINAIQSGVRSYLLKEDLGAHLAQAIVIISSGGWYFSPKLRNLLPGSNNFLNKRGKWKGESIFISK
jgi:DNA-binding NarL/FixJ family response regulator